MRHDPKWVRTSDPVSMLRLEYCVRCVNVRAYAYNHSLSNCLWRYHTIAYLTSVCLRVKNITNTLAYADLR